METKLTQYFYLAMFTLSAQLYNILHRFIHIFVLIFSYLITKGQWYTDGRTEKHSSFYSKDYIFNAY